MKFTCDSCSAQYMISDDKVGPNGVKVRCKKCGKVVLVRRAAEVTPAAAAGNGAADPTAPAGGAHASAGAGLDAELGHAFDNVFGDPAAAAAAAAAAAPQPGADPGATQAMGSEDRERIDSAPAPAPTEWYVAIGQAQVGPLPLAEVKKKWEAGDVGPDSLVWRPGMTDWQAVTAVPELAGFLAPVPRPAPKAAPKAEPQPSRDRTPAATPAAAGGRDVSWKPAGASALAALASEEIARGSPEPKPAAAQAPVPTGAKSLVDALPDGGGVDPTGALPLSIKGLETTGEKKLERRSTVAHRAEEARHRRSVSRAIVVVVALLAVVAAAAGGGWWYMNRPATPPAVATATPQPAPAVAQPTPPAPPPAPAQPQEPAVAAAPPAPPPPAAEPPDAPTPAAPPEVAAAPAQPAAPAGAPPARGSRTRAKREPATRVAAAPTPAPAAQAPAPTPTPAPPPAKKRNGLLDFDSSSDSALDEALGGGSGRTVYVPPARAGGNGALPEKLSTSQINEAVAGRIDSLRRCVSEQKEREPGTSGVLKMRWIIAGDGGVRDVKCLTSEYAQGPFAQCITGVVKTIKFPRSATTGQEVTFPFSF